MADQFCSRCEGPINVGGRTYWQLPKDSGDARIRGWTHLCDTCHKVWLHNTGKEGIPMKTEHAESKIVEAVNHPTHYNAGKFEVIEVIEDWKLGFNDGNAVKYIGRARHKGKLLEDAEKARWYVDRFVQEHGGDTWNPVDREADEVCIEVETENPMQAQVREFIAAMDHPVTAYPGSWPDAQAKRRCKQLISGEYAELMEAIELDDWPEIIDGGIDLLYVVFYLFNVIGIDARMFFDEVHRTNLAKRGGPIDPQTGKQLKPEGWEPPDIEGMLAELRVGSGK